LPALSADLIGFENLSGLGWSESEFAELENLQNGLRFYSVNSKILEILIRTISYPSTTNYRNSYSWHSLIRGARLLSNWNNTMPLVIFWENLISNGKLRCPTLFELRLLDNDGKVNIVCLKDGTGEYFLESVKQNFGDW